MCMYSGRGLLNFENEEYVVSYLLLGWGSASSIILLLWSFCPHGGIYLLLNCGVGEHLRVPWTARRFNQSILKEVSPVISLEGMMLKLKLQYSGLENLMDKGA